MNQPDLQIAMSTALITGVNGQDGSYLAELLLAKGYRVVGTTPDASIDRQRISNICERIEIVQTDLLSEHAIEEVLAEYSPVEVYNLAARASSSDLWNQPVLTGDLNGLTVARLLSAIQKVDKRIRFIQASSSEIFGNAAEVPQTELTPLQPRNPYGIAKAYAHWAAALYREHEGLFACSAILYNHESPRRGLEFVTRKITNAAARISLGLTTELRLGRLDARRDWGYAADYVHAMWLMLQQHTAGDYIVATGETHSVLEFCELAFAHVGLNYKDYVIEDLAGSRPPESTQLLGNPAKANRVLGWRPSVRFPELVRMMVEADLQAIKERDVSANTKNRPVTAVQTNG